MATKYLDHGAYNNAVFVASTSGSSTTLTVASVSSGCLSPGQFITGTGITEVASPVFGTYITAVTYNASNVATSVTMSAAMTVPSGTTVAASYGEPAIVPLWGQAQDGDGSLPGLAIPSEAEIVFTGIPSSGAIAVLGVAVTVTWATSADNCANLLASAINALATTATSPASFVIKGPVRNHVYARGPATGAPAGTCQIMTRQASADHAGLIAITHTLNNVSSTGTINFSGGSGGAWGHAFRNFAYAMWPTSVTTYGVLNSSFVYCGNFASGDICKIRADKTVPVSASANFTISNKGSLSSPIEFEVGYFPEWGGVASPVFVMDCQLGTNGAAINFFSGSGTSFYKFSAQVYASGVRAFKIQSRSGYLGNGGAVVTAVAGMSVIQNIHVENLNTSGRATIGYGSGSGGTSGRISGSLFKHGADNGGFIAGGGNPGVGDISIVDCTLEYVGSFIVTLIYAPVYSNVYLNISGLVCLGFLTGSSLCSAFGISYSFEANFTNCYFGGITLRGPYYNSLTLVNGDSVPCITISDLGPSGNFSVDTRAGFVEWNNSLEFPVRSATLLDGISYWSIRVAPNINGGLKRSKPLMLPALYKINSLATGVIGITVHLLVDTTALSLFYKSDVWLVVSYIETDGRQRSYELAGSYADLLDSDASAAWDKTTFSAGGSLTYEKRKVTVTTPTAMLTDTLFSAVLCIGKSVANSTQFIFVCPEVEVEAA